MRLVGSQLVTGIGALFIVLASAGLPLSEQLAVPDMAAPADSSNQAGNQPTSGEEIPWFVVAAGATESGSATYRVRGTAGQTAVGLSLADDRAIAHGFWQRAGCCQRRTGDVDLIGDFPNEIDSSDLGLLVSYLFSPPGTVELPCTEEADVDALGGENPVDSSDLGLLVSFLFSPPGSVVLPSCP